MPHVTCGPCHESRVPRWAGFPRIRDSAAHIRVGRLPTHRLPRRMPSWQPCWRGLVVACLPIRSLRRSMARMSGSYCVAAAAHRRARRGAAARCVTGPGQPGPRSRFQGPIAPRPPRATTQHQCAYACEGASAPGGRPRQAAAPAAGPARDTRGRPTPLIPPCTAARRPLPSRSRPHLARPRDARVAHARRASTVTHRVRQSEQASLELVNASNPSRSSSTSRNASNRPHAP